ncbi:cyclic pyranopterin phosphate synthase [Propionibacterium cyclohexanicum]|uniref:GTP 3',8-cyclase n=1 Tax=Propionibacterium cyclohexanicum TaxID=64702 RepID=A0A1H9RIW0_9ACTN|nr:GTP 3',8-cyclase MoaA [Propionibacterium cyclohexanicum]SER72682.1 cyclic pyranopterin phosphate synthase [Propionibacterium cyclohexanicum]
MSEPDLDNAPGLLRDRFGRVARDLRVSLTDRCNLRCAYCMPPEGLEWLPVEATLSDDEVIRLCTLAVRELGIRKLRFTGGEPLLRRGLERIVAACARLVTDLGTHPELALTTNGMGLSHRAGPLATAGLSRVNVSLDTIDPAHFHQLTRRDRLPEVLAGLRAARAAGLTPIKVNAVVMRGINDADAPALLDFCVEEGIELRFIEQMPIGPADTWDRQNLFTRREILELLSVNHELHPDETTDPHSPARRWTIDGDPTKKVGIISSVTEPFCENCDRTRLTSDGQLRSCLFSGNESDLRGPLRRGASDRELAEIWRAAMYLKPRAHGLDNAEFAIPSRTMSRIGG